MILVFEDDFSLKFRVSCLGDLTKQIEEMTTDLTDLVSSGILKMGKYLST